MTQKQITERLQIAARPSIMSGGAGAKTERRHSLIRYKSSVNNAAAPKCRMVRTFSGGFSSTNHSSSNSIRCRRRGHGTPAAGEVLIQRALTPPKRRLTLRWWNFRPTPSRLSSMSMAS
ncbi:hypothetical protein TorRG33x02_223860 [Trema orientale]|uniref:Uncharacterized protein n=1 Tax=Trema orientale TaxID=63057 RepID=A0A2P5E8M9_TREOI|nr:hypothetical protein TorRG33x02_223860 [Trema orientale]